MSQERGLPSVTVIVPVRDGASDLDRCLAALGRQGYPAHLRQTVVADNGSTEDIAAVVSRHEGVELVHEQVGGSYSARNAGLGLATGEVIAFTDADCSPRPDWLSQAVTALSAEPAADMVGGAVELTYRRGRPISGSEWFEAVHGFPQADYLTHQSFAVTANMVTWRRTFDEVGPFDASLKSRGDADWGQRVASRGGSMRYAADAVVEHPARADLSASLEKWLRVSNGRVRADLKAGRSRKHFLGCIRWQLTVWLQTVVTVRSLPPMTTWPQRLRYLASFGACRVVYVAVYLKALLPGRLRAAW